MRGGYPQVSKTAHLHLQPQIQAVKLQKTLDKLSQEHERERWLQVVVFISNIYL